MGKSNSSLLAYILLNNTSMALGKKMILKSKNIFLYMAIMLVLIIDVLIDTLYLY